MRKVTLKGLAMHNTRAVLTTLAVVIGVAMIITTIAAGGGPLSRGILLGVLFAAAGGIRLYLQTRMERGT